MNKLKISSLLVICLFLCVSTFQGQSKEVRLFRSLSRIQLIKSDRKDVDRLFKNVKFTENKGEKGFKTIYYDFKYASLAVYFSTGKCSEHASRYGYEIEKGVVVGWSLHYFRLVKASEFPFDLSKFQQIPESDNDSITYEEKKLGIEVTGGRGFVYDIEYSLSEEDEKKYSCESRIKH